MKTKRSETGVRKPITARDIAHDLVKFEKRRKVGMRQIDKLQAELKRIDAEIETYVEGLIACV